MATVSARPLADTIRAKADQDGIKFFFAQFVDMNAKPSAKLVPIENWEGLVTEGAGFAGFAAGPIGQSPASPDMMAIPDLASYTPVPFKPGLARFACDITVEGEEWPYCPRTILRRQLARAKELGYTFKVGMELEFFLLRVAQDGRVRDRRGEALQKLAEYDRRHQAQLLLTLEEYLRRRGNIAAAAQTLYVHPNTLRQRLRRIQELTGLDVADEDWLMIEIELKLLRLEQALGAG